MQNTVGQCNHALLQKKASHRLLRGKEAQRDGLIAPSPRIPTDRMMKTVMSMIKPEKPQGYQTGSVPWCRYLYKDF